MRKSPFLPERKRVVATDNGPIRGHELARIAERLPGEEPTNASISLTDGPSYEAYYWRCLGCGEERNKRREFINHCTAARTLARMDGGYSVTDARTRAALSEDMEIHPVHDDCVYGVRGDSRITHRVDLQEETCTCTAFQRDRAFCKHLRRVDIAVRTGTVPDLTV